MRSEGRARDAICTDISSRCSACSAKPRLRDSIAGNEIACEVERQPQVQENIGIRDVRREGVEHAAPGTEDGREAASRKAAQCAVPRGIAGRNCRLSVEEPPAQCNPLFVLESLERRGAGAVHPCLLERRVGGTAQGASNHIGGFDSDCAAEIGVTNRGQTSQAAHHRSAAPGGRGRETEKGFAIRRHAFAIEVAPRTLFVEFGEQLADTAFDFVPETQKFSDHPLVIRTAFDGVRRIDWCAARPALAAREAVECTTERRAHEKRLHVTRFEMHPTEWQARPEGDGGRRKARFAREPGCGLCDQSLEKLGDARLRADDPR